MSLSLTRIAAALLLVSACGPVDASQSAGGSDADAPEPVLQSSAAHANAGELPVVQVWKTPTCGCCGEWVSHMEEAGFAVEVQDLTDLTPVKDEHGVPMELRSCHTAHVDGLTVEGHVPADVIRDVLADRQDLDGIAVPGMPIGSPGMEVPGRAGDRYQVIGFSEDGSRRVVAER